jgi:hypothetical protein
MSTFIYVTFHASKAATEFVHSNTEFEHYASRYNVTIQNIRVENGVNSAQLFQDACTQSQQNLTFCAIGAHWQNGISECFVGIILSVLAPFYYIPWLSGLTPLKRTC